MDREGSEKHLLLREEANLEPVIFPNGISGAAKVTGLILVKHKTLPPKWNMWVTRIWSCMSGPNGEQEDHDPSRHSLVRIS